MTNVIKIDNSNRKKQVHFLQYIENKVEVNIDEINIVENIVIDSTIAITLYFYRNLIYKMTQTIIESRNFE